MSISLLLPEASSFADATVMDIRYQYGGGRYPGGVIRPVTFIADSWSGAGHEVFQYPAAAARSVLHTSGEVVFPRDQR